MEKIPRSSVPTPALVIDLDVLERNIASMATAAAQWGVQLRPHAKSHKCAAIARAQIARGAAGVSCATLEEVAAMVDAGIPGILMTSPVVGEPKLSVLGSLLRRDPRIMVVADDPAAVTELSALSKGLGVRLQVLADFDVGQRRTGCRTVASAVALAGQIQSTPGLEFAGVQAYAGHIQHTHTRVARATAVSAVADQVRTLCSSLERAQLRPRIVTGAGTGSVEIDGPGGVYTELQPGSYVFMDADYLAVEGLGARYEPSLFVDTTVIGTQWDNHVTTDAGTKSFALNGPAPLSASAEPGWTYSYDGDEFGRVTLAPGARRPSRGERLAFVVSHCDPTVVLYPYFVCVRDGWVEGYWPITPRQAVPHSADSSNRPLELGGGRPCGNLRRLITSKLGRDLQTETSLRKRRSALLILLAAVVAGCATPPRKSPEQAAADEALAAQIYSALKADEIHFYRHVNVEVDNGVVQLSGYVWDTDDMYLAKQLAGRVPGVIRVVNQMELERNGSRGGGHSGSG